MSLVKLLDPSYLVSAPPPGAVNVRTGKSVLGPGGKWVPCATEISVGVYCPSVFEIGPGRRQVCNANTPCQSVDEALSRAIELARSAAA